MQDALPILTDTAIDRESVLAVARCEASGASDSGFSTLSRAQLVQAEIHRLLRHH